MADKPNANFTPDQDPYKKLVPLNLCTLTNFPFIDETFDSLTYYEFLCKVVEYLNNVIENEQAVTNNTTALLNAYNQLQDYVNHYFDSLDITTEINNKIDDMVQDGTLQELFKPYFSNLEDSINDLNNKVTSIASGSPAGVFNTLEELESSQDTDKNRIYVVQETGNWYYWNGTNWVSGGTYQSSVIADNSINNFQTQFLKQGINKLLGLYNNEKGINVTPLENGNIKLQGVATASPQNFPIAKFTIENEDDYLFYCKIISGKKQGMYIYNTNDPDTIVATISTGATNKTIHLSIGTYTLNAYFDTGTNVNLEMFLQLSSISKLNENKFDNNYFKPSLIQKFTNEMLFEKYSIKQPLILPMISDLVQNIGTIDLINCTLKLNENIYTIFNVPFYPGNTNIVLSYQKLKSINENIVNEFNLVSDKTKSGINVCSIDYLGNLKSTHYNDFINNIDNDIILFYFYFSLPKNRITSYNTLGNNFTILGNINPNTDFNSLTYNAIGDSLTYGYLNSSTQMAIPYPLAVQNQLNLATSYNNGLTGTTVADDRSVMQSFYPMSADERMETYQNTDIISIMGGTNDFAKNVTLGDINTEDTTTFYGGYKKLLNYLITNNPTSLIFTITPPWTQNAPTTNNTKGYSRQDITNAIKEISSYFGIPCLDMNSLGQLGFVNKTTWTVDGTHFTQEYVSNIFSKKVANFIYNNIQELPN